jgi:hypothetical protein
MGLYKFLLFTPIINFAVQQTSVFVIVIHFLLALTNAFYVTELIMAIKSFVIDILNGYLHWQHGKL